jgi:hypothetical protein
MGSLRVSILNADFGLLDSSSGSVAAYFEV